MAGSASGTQAPLTGLDVPLARVQRLPDRRSLSFRRFRRWTGHYQRLFRRAASGSTSDQLFVYQQAAKLVEEVGELHAALLAADGLQRPDKLRADARAAIEAELADVLICSAILAAALDIDIEAATLIKMDTVDERMSRTRGRTTRSG